VNERALMTTVISKDYLALNMLKVLNNIKIHQFKSLTVVLVFFALHQSVTGQILLNSDAEFFGASESFSRYYQGGVYLMKNEKTGKVKAFKEYKFIGDFHEGVAIFQSAEGRFGVVNSEFHEVINPVWSEIKDLGQGYLALAVPTGQFKIEDRGQGNIQYPVLKWKLATKENAFVLKEISFTELISMGGVLTGKTVSGRQLNINLSKINVSYFDPFMKAIMHVDGTSVSSTIVNASGKSVYTSKQDGEVKLELIYNQHPFSLYQLD
jgi:hypothetical protein